jgi:TOMM system kinase/cyclase fusion protein
MECPRCRHENGPRARFCEECGSALTDPACATCGATLSAAAKFCPACGRRLSSAEAPAAASPAEPGAERRQLTVLFCDLVGSTALAARLDPEDFREIVRAYQAACADVIARFDGHIAQYLGDGLLIYFGYPQAHEDDAQRAVRAGLGILKAVGRLEAQGQRLAVRIGIHTGAVVVGDVGGEGRQERLALGEAPNVAARLQALADPGGVVVSATTQRLVAGFFRVRDLGPQSPKGVPEPLQVYAILDEGPARSRLDAATPAGLTPLVGREREVGLLLDRWAQACEGRGHVVLLSGEAGIGKSRLVEVLKERVADAPHRRLEARCSPYYEHTPLHPIIDLLPRILGWDPNDGPEERRLKLEAHLTRTGMVLAETVPLLGALLSLPASDRYPLPPMSPVLQRRKTLEALITAFLAPAPDHPALLIVEDLHWIDPSTAELLTLMLDQVPTAPVLAVFTARPSFGPPWTPRSHVDWLMLDRFTRAQTEQMVERVTGGKRLPPEVLQQVVTKTDGVPLFVEELTKMVLELGLVRVEHDRYELTGPLPRLAIPATLHDSLMARLDRLATVKEVAQLAATLGRVFPYELLRAVWPRDDATLERELRRLVEAELLYQRGIPPKATYTFKHALIQEAAYQSLLRSTRQQSHQRIARVLEAGFPEIRETQPELLAHHYTEAGLVAQAVPYWQQAGQRAVQRSAHAEAIAHLTKGLEGLASLPDGPERIQQELVLQTTLGPALLARKGSGAPEMERAYARALALCRQVGDTPQLFPALRGLWRFCCTRGELATARELAEQLLALAQRLQAPAVLLEAHHALGQTLFCLGELRAAQAHLEQSIALYDPDEHRSHAFRYGYDPRVGCLIYRACALWLLGHPAQALKSSEDALSLAHALAHPFSLAYALHFAAMVHELRGEALAGQQRAEATLRLATEQGFPLWVAGGTVLRGWALAAQGGGAEGILQMSQGIAAWRATGAGVLLPYYLTVLAEAYRKAGRTTEGLTVLTEAVEAGHRTGERARQAELYRLKGDLLLAVSTENHGQAEVCFAQALEVARGQGARALELRASMSLGRLRLRQGRRRDARRQLADIYGRFTEGFETADLIEAKALLEALA